MLTEVLHLSLQEFSPVPISLPVALLNTQLAHKSHRRALTKQPAMRLTQDIYSFEHASLNFHGDFANFIGRALEKKK